MKPRRSKGVDVVFDRVPPQSIEAERSVLGACLLNPEAIGAALEILREDPEHVFYVEAHRHIYSAILDLFRRNTPVDPVTLMQCIEAAGNLDQIGGASYIAELAGCVPTSANIEYYAGIVADAAQRRKLITTCTRIVGLAYGAADENDEILSTKDLIQQAESIIFSIGEHSQKITVHSLKEIVQAQCEVVENIVVNKTFSGIPTRFKDFDKLTYGLKLTEMTVIAARPSVGKTALALNLAETFAQTDHRVLIVSLEMAKEQLAQRMIYNAGGIESWRVSGHSYDRDEIKKKLRQADQALSGLPIKVIDVFEITPNQIMGLCRRQKAGQGMDVLIVDYLQLMTPNNKRLPREQQVSECSRMMKQISKECNCHVILLCQFNREADKDGSPKLSHLRESGSIEQDCDNALLLSRNEDGTLNCHLAKHRNGSTGEFRLYFNKNTQTFQNCATDGQIEYAPIAPRHNEIPWRDHTEPKPAQEFESHLSEQLDIAQLSEAVNFLEEQNPGYDDGDDDEFPY